MSRVRVRREPSRMRGSRRSSCARWRACRRTPPIGVRAACRGPAACQPMLPMRPGQAARRSHDYTPPWHDLALRRSRHRHRAGDRKVLRAPSRHRVPQIPRRDRGNVPRDLDVHLVIDNYATHKTPLIRNWLARRLRWHVHLTQPVRPGSTRSSGSSPCPPSGRSDAASTAASTPCTPPLTSSSSATMPIQNLSAGPNQPTIFSPPSSGSAATMLQPTRSSRHRAFWFRTLA
jgi:hypothetical protein